MSSDSSDACRRVCLFFIQPEILWSPLLGSCEMPSEMKGVKTFDFRELHFCCTGSQPLLWAGSKCVRERSLQFSWRLLLQAPHFIKFCSETQHTQTHTPCQVFWKQWGKYFCAKWNTMRRALKDIHMNLVLLPKEDFTYLPVCPYATENLCKYLGRCLSRHLSPLKKAAVIFFTLWWWECEVWQGAEDCMAAAPGLFLPWSKLLQIFLPVCECEE